VLENEPASPALQRLATADDVIMPAAATPSTGPSGSGSGAVGGASSGVGGGSSSGGGGSGGGGCGDVEAPKRKEESRQKGVVTFETYKTYARAGQGSMLMTLFLFVLLMSAQVFDIMTNWWLKEWASMSVDEQNGDRARNVYGALIASTTALSFARCFLFMFGAVRAARVLHQRALTSVLGSPIHYFDTTPVGTTLNK
jgi:hypothetical protein